MPCCCQCKMAASWIHVSLPLMLVFLLSLVQFPALSKATPKLTDGQKIEIYLQPASTSTLSFHLEKDFLPIYIQVTPCGGSVQWSLSSPHRKFEEWDDEDILPEGSGSDSWESIEGSGSDVSTTDDENVKIKKENSVLFREIGRGQTEIEDHELRKGTYYIHVTSMAKRPIAVSVYFTKDRRKNPILTSQVSDLSVSIDGIGQSEVFFSWRRSQPFRSTAYCAVLSSTEPYLTYCDALAAINNQIVSYETRNTSFSHGSQSSPVVLHLPSEPVKKKPLISCVTHDSKNEFLKLQSNTKYFLNLFSIDKHTGISHSYKGASFMTASKHHQHFPAPTHLPDAVTLAGFLNPMKRYSKTYSFALPDSSSNVTLAVQPCSGSIYMKVTQNGRKILKKSVEDLAILTVGNLEKGSVLISITNGDGDAKIFRMWASTDPSKNPYPSLPFDTSLRVKRRTCSSIVLNWIVRNMEYNYCLYNKLEKNDYFKQLVLETANQCRGPAAAMKKISCAHFDKDLDSTQENLVMGETVVGLHPGKTYRFDLYVSKNSGKHEVSYRTIWVKTKKHCG